MSEYPSEAVSFIVVEDNPGHILLFKRVLRRSNFFNPVITFEDGREALENIKNWDVSKPAIVILDLNLPLIHGSQVICESRKIYSASELPIIVVSTTMDEKEIQYCKDLGSQNQLRKPFKQSDLLESIQLFGDNYSTSGFKEENLLLKHP